MIPGPVLLAEDDENDVLFLERAFKEAGITNPLHVTVDGQETIDWLSGVGKFADRSTYPMPWLLILDLKMPRKSGLDVLQWLREQPVLGCLPVLVLSSSALRHDIERAYRLGANAFVVKPGSIEERKELADLIKGFWLKFNNPPALCTEGLQAAQKLHRDDPLSPSFFSKPSL